MGFYNVLNTSVTCLDCGGKTDARIQFKYAHTFQLEYRIGETLKWFDNRDIGSADLGDVKAYGIMESDIICQHCGKNSFAEEYDIFIKQNIMVSASPIERLEDYLIDEEGCYVPLG